MSNQHRLNWARIIHRDAWVCHCSSDVDSETCSLYQSRQDLVGHVKLAHPQAIDSLGFLEATAASKRPHALPPLRESTCPFCGEKVTLDTTARRSTNSSNAESLQTPKPRSVGGEDGGLAAQGVNIGIATSVSKTSAVTNNMSNHIADHLELIALWSLRWWDDDSGAPQDASQAATNECRTDRSAFNRDEDWVDDELAHSAELEIPDCASSDPAIQLGTGGNFGK